MGCQASEEGATSNPVKPANTQQEEHFQGQKGSGAGQNVSAKPRDSVKIKDKSNKIPTGSSKADIQARSKIFRDFDVNGNNWLSLAEIDKGLRDVLCLPYLFDAKPVIMRAYQESLKKVKSQNELTEGLVSKGAFKFTLIYLKFYYELWEDFKFIDKDGERRISEAEFVKGKDILVKQWKLKIDDPRKKFSEILIKYGAEGNITFTQFCDYVIGERFKEIPDLDSHNEI